AGFGVAMGNAIPEIKDLAQYVTADNNHDGLGLAVEKFVL
ncbi:MAG: HAD hydrolase family protein, partial [Ligilactobacillus agilis]|nr:HAD hydrolase family protein [Ligilactobacillus agilis]